MNVETTRKSSRSAKSLGATGTFGHENMLMYFNIHKGDQALNISTGKQKTHKKVSIFAPKKSKSSANLNVFNKLSTKNVNSLKESPKVIQLQRVVSNKIVHNISDLEYNGAERQSDGVLSLLSDSNIVTEILGFDSARNFSYMLLSESLETNFKLIGSGKESSFVAVFEPKDAPKLKEPEKPKNTGIFDQNNLMTKITKSVFNDIPFAVDRQISFNPKDRISGLYSTAVKFEEPKLRTFSEKIFDAFFKKSNSKAESTEVNHSEIMSNCFFNKISDDSYYMCIFLSNQALNVCCIDSYKIIGGLGLCNEYFEVESYERIKSPMYNNFFFINKENVKQEKKLSTITVSSLRNVDFVLIMNCPKEPFNSKELVSLVYSTVLQESDNFEAFESYYSIDLDELNKKVLKKIQFKYAKKHKSGSIAILLMKSLVDLNVYSQETLKNNLLRQQLRLANIAQLELLKVSQATIDHKFTSTFSRNNFTFVKLNDNVILKACCCCFSSKSKKTLKIQDKTPEDSKNFSQNKMLNP